MKKKTDINLNSQAKVKAKSIRKIKKQEKGVPVN